MRVKTPNGIGELVKETKEYVIVEINGKEHIHKKTNQRIKGEFHVPCKRCDPYGCYNFAMGDCKDPENYKWLSFKSEYIPEDDNKYSNLQK